MIRASSLEISQDRPKRGLTRYQSWVLTAVWLTLAGVLWREFTFSYSVTMIGSYNLTIFDPIFLVWAGACIFGVFQSRLRMTWLTVCSFALGLILAINFARGALTNLSAAAFAVRADGLIILIIIAAALSNFTPNFERRMGQAVLLAGSILAVLSLSRFAAFPGFPFYATTLGENEGRPLSNEGALLIAMTLAIALSAYVRAYRIGRISTFLLAILASLGLIISAQGTAIIVGCVMAIIVLLLDGKRLRLITSVVGAGLLFTLIWVDSSAGFVSLLDNEQQDMITRRLNNLSTRESIWQGFKYYFDKSSIANKFFGPPFGFERKFMMVLESDRQVEWNLSLHSAYFGGLSVYGISGIILQLGVIFIAGKRLITGPAGRDRFLTPAVALSAALGLLLLGYTYEWRIIASLLVFMLLGSAWRPLYNCSSREHQLKQVRLVK